MEGYADRLERLVITTISPDKSVKLVFRQRDGISVEFAPNRLKQHTDKSLARQLEAVSRLAIVGLQKSSRRMVDDFLADSDGDNSDRIELSPELKRFAECRDDITAQGRSSRGRIFVKRHLSHGVAVDVRPGTVSGLAQGQVSAEFVSALTNAMKDQQEKVKQLRVRIFGSE